jgi:hypothetical protein
MAEGFSVEDLIKALQAKGRYVVSDTDPDRSKDTHIPDPHTPSKRKPIEDLGAHGLGDGHKTPPRPPPPPPTRLFALSAKGTGGAHDTLASGVPGTGVKFKYGPPKGTSTPFAAPLLGHDRSVSHDVSQYRLTSAVPKLPFFSGDDQKGDISYVEWKFEIRCLMEDPDVTAHIAVQAIRRSLRGTARRLLVSLGESASAADIFRKLDSSFGDVSTHGMLMQEFFNSFQKPDESVAKFGCRLEYLLQLAVEQGQIAKEAKNDLLRHKFWTSLSSKEI